MDIIPGKNPVMAALNAGKSLQKIILEKKDQSRVSDIVSAAKKTGTPIEYGTKAELDGLTKGTAHQGVVGIAQAFEYADVSDMLLIARNKGEPPFVIILDHIEDPHNFGAILRTAEAAGVHGVIIPNKRGALITPAVHKTSSGAASYIPVAIVSNIASTIESLKKQGLWVYCLDAKGGSLYKENMTGPVALVIGSEGSGVSALVAKKADITISIPMQGQMTSLNASVAAGVAVYEIIRQRRFA